MAWVKDSVSRSPKTVYLAPEEMAPLVALVFDPNDEPRWTAEYAYLNQADETQGDVETLMGL